MCVIFNLSYQWILHVDWWVDFVYFTSLPFSMEIYTYLYNGNVIQHSFIVIDQGGPNRNLLS